MHTVIILQGFFNLNYSSKSIYLVWFCSCLIAYQILPVWRGFMLSAFHLFVKLFTTIFSWHDFVLVQLLYQTIPDWYNFVLSAIELSVKLFIKSTYLIFIIYSTKYFLKMQFSIWQILYYSYIVAFGTESYDVGTC